MWVLRVVIGLICGGLFEGLVGIWCMRGCGGLRWVVVVGVTRGVSGRVGSLDWFEGMW